MLEDVQALSVGRHQAVLDAVVDHFDEVASAGRAAVQIAFLGGASYLVAAGGAINIAAARSECFENRIETSHDVGLAADHLAIAAFEAPNAAAGADVAIVDALGGEFFRTADVIDIVRISAIDHGVSGFEFSRQIAQRGIDDRGRYHQPNRAGLLEFLDEIIEGSCTGCAFAFQLLDGFRTAIIYNALVTVFLQAPHHVGAHSSQPDHAKLHGVRSSLRRVAESCLGLYAIAFCTAFESAASPDFRFFPRWTRRARRPRSARTAKSPRACAAFTTPKVYFCPGTGRSLASSQVICRKTPLFGPPLYACPVECRKRGPKPRTVATFFLSRTA